MQKFKSHSVLKVDALFNKALNKVRVIENPFKGQPFISITKKIKDNFKQIA